MTPQEVEAQLAGQPDIATVAAVLDRLREDPAWTVTEITVNGRLVQVELAHEATDRVYTLSTTRPDAGARQRGDDADADVEKRV